MIICNLLPNRVILREKGVEREGDIDSHDCILLLISQGGCQGGQMLILLAPEIGVVHQDMPSNGYHILGKTRQLASFHTGTVTNRLSYVQTLTSATVFVAPVLAFPILFTQIQKKLCRITDFRCTRQLTYLVSLLCRLAEGK